MWSCCARHALILVLKRSPRRGRLLDTEQFLSWVGRNSDFRSAPLVGPHVGTNCCLFLPVGYPVPKWPPKCRTRRTLIRTKRVRILIQNLPTHPTIKMVALSFLVVVGNQCYAIINHSIHLIISAIVSTFLSGAGRLQRQPVPVSRLDASSDCAQAK